jgi:iron complex outermembrane recepter protein
MSTTLDVYQITVTNRIVGSGEIIGSSGGAPISPIVNSAIVASGNQLDPTVAATGTTGINVFANGIDTKTRGADLVFDFPVDYAFAKVNWSIGATYTDNTITKYASTPAALAGNVNGLPANELYDPEAYSDLTTANPKFVINLGALMTLGNWTVNLVEKIYGPSSEYESDDGDNGGTGPGTFPACVPKAGTLFICPGNFQYYKSSIGVTPITNLDIGYQFFKRLKVSIGANNLFNKFPPLLNPTLRAHEDSFAYGDAQGVIQYPPFSPFGINGGFYYAKVSCKF